MQSLTTSHSYGSQCKWGGKGKWPNSCGWSGNSDCQKKCMQDQDGNTVVIGEIVKEIVTYDEQ